MTVKSGEKEGNSKFHVELLRLAGAHKKYNMSNYNALGLSTGQPKILSILSEKEGYLQKDLAKRCGIEPATLTVILNSMIAKDLVLKKTEYVSGGQRAFGIYLTEHGKDLAEQVNKIVEASEEKSFEGFTEEEKGAFINMMRRITKNLTLVATIALLTACSLTLTACAKKEQAEPQPVITATQDAPAVTEVKEPETVSEPVKEEVKEAQNEETLTTAEAEAPVAEEPVAEEPVAEEPVAEEPVAEEPVVEEPVVEIKVMEPFMRKEYTPVDEIPEDYTKKCEISNGSVQIIEYETKDYAGDLSPVTKHANVYLPAGYSEDQKYDVLYLMHGVGGSENEWGLKSATSKLAKIMDNLVANGNVTPFIIVCPNGRSCAKPSDASFNNIAGFYQFGQELRNELIPYIESHFSTYADYSEEGYDLSATRNHRAMAGLSMGGMQTLNIGICECTDIIGWFGAFSAAPTSYEAAKIAQLVNDNFSDYEIGLLYNICGTEDGTAYASASAAAKTLPELSDKFVDGTNYLWHERSGGHDWAIWYLGFYNFSQMIF